jgi:hypothetical protein
MAPGTRVTAVGIYSIYSAREGKSSKVGPLAACHCSDSRVWVLLRCELIPILCILCIFLSFSVDFIANSVLDVVCFLLFFQVLIEMRLMFELQEQRMSETLQNEPSDCAGVG